MCQKICNYVKNIKPKRFALPIVGVFGLLVLEEWRDIIHFPIVIFVGTLVLLWNFPSFIYYTTSKPLFYEDIFIDPDKVPDYNVHPKLKKKFETIMQWIFVITNSLLTSALAEYWLLKTVKIKNYVEILGVTGGILKIFQAINHSLGVILLKMFKHLIEKENRKLKQLKENTNEHTRLESKERENIRAMTI